MKNLRKKSATVLLAAGIIFAGTGTAGAAISAGGGSWDYGVDYWSMKTWSNYYHATKVHSSTACNANRCVSSGPTPKDRWSYASLRATWGGNTSYWNN
ncbi:lactococcin 972 family bacteriocin [Canibacter oris]|uniref:Lactococcin 972 family bacteriocin n=1 Tax=Canibacter oris TaxID=1365628 RepID=A0A840DE05_9MICO|nr:lactococcin 972 family bacteriocin [Canibacter oris]